MGLLGRIADKAKDVVAGHLLAYDADRRTLRISHYVVAAASHVAAMRTAEVATLASTMAGDSLSISAELRNGTRVSARLVPQRLVLNGDEARVEAELPGGVDPNATRPLQSYLVGLFDGLFGVGKAALAKVPVVSFDGVHFSYIRPRAELDGLQRIVPASSPSERIVPLRIDDQWLEVDFSSVLPAGHSVDLKTLLPIASALLAAAKSS
jgi:hypothetical protein